LISASAVSDDRVGATAGKEARLAVIASMRSFRGGTGKSNTTAKVAALLAHG
jgi:hypothetical protein